MNTSPSLVDGSGRHGRPLTAASRPGTLRSLAPREHGAYGQLALPIVTALAMGRPGPGAVALALAASLAFVAHEPLLVLAGQRGPRARREDGVRAGRRLAVLGAATALLGLGGLAVAPPDARLSALVPLSLSALLAPFIARKAEKTTAGELLAAAALSSTGVPVALASGAPASLAWGAWLTFFLAFAASTFGVRAVVAHARAPIPWLRRAAAPALVALLALGLGAAGVLSPAATLGAVPMLTLALILSAAPPAPTSLRRVGWRLVGASVILSLALAVGAHL